MVYNIFMQKLCSFTDCVNTLYAKNLCSGHYSQAKRGQTLRPIVIKTNKASDIPCTFSGCVNMQQAKLLCGAHWRQQHLGKELTILSNQIPIMARILDNIEKTDYCWVWTGRVSGKRGYPQISLSGRQVMVHRVVFEEVIRLLLPGETIDHLCRNRVCVNPEHLEPIPLRDNVKRMHAYKSLLQENKKLVDFIEGLGYNSTTLERRD
jgi:hypothetical protein